MSKIKFKSVLQKLLKDRSISARELARQTGIPQSTLNNYLSGREPKVDNVLVLAKFFGTSMEYLLYGVDDRPPTLDDVLTEGIFDGWLRVKIERAIPNKRKG